MKRKIGVALVACLAFLSPLAFPFSLHQRAELRDEQVHDACVRDLRGWRTLDRIITQVETDSGNSLTVYRHILGPKPACK